LGRLKTTAETATATEEAATTMLCIPGWWCIQRSRLSITWRGEKMEGGLVFNSDRCSVSVQFTWHYLQCSVSSRTSGLGKWDCSSSRSSFNSWASLLMLQSSSCWKSGLICLHNNIWLITLPKLEGAVRAGAKLVKTIC